MQQQSMLLVAAATLLLASASLAAAQSPAGSCQVQFVPAPPTSLYKATYDLSALKAVTAPSICGENAWFSEDFEDLIGETIDYYFCYNFCENLAQPPPTVPAGLCSAAGVMPAGNVYQLYNDTTTGLNTRCHVVSQASNLTWALLDQYNPAQGLVQIYGNGDACYPTNAPRTITVQLRCRRTPTGAPVFSTVREDHCAYSLTVDTLAACPIECPRVNGQLCNGHGVCGGDDDIKAVRCFCNSGWAGEDCATQGTTGSGTPHATAVLVAFVIILVVALLIMSVVLWRKIKRLNADDSRYGQLSDDGSAAAPRRPAANHASAGGVSAASDESRAAQEQGAANQLAAAVGDNV